MGLNVPEGHKGGNYVLHSSTLLLCRRNIPHYLDLTNGVWGVIGVLSRLDPTQITDNIAVTLIRSD